MPWKIDYWVYRLLEQSVIPKFPLQIKTDLLFKSFQSGIKCSINNLFISRIYAFGRLSHTHTHTHTHTDTHTHTQGLKLPMLFWNDTKKEVLQQQINGKSITYAGDTKYKTETLIRRALQSSLQSSKRRFWTSSIRTLTLYDSHLQLKLLMTAHVWNIFL